MVACVSRALWRRHRRSLRVQAEASKPASFNHFTIKLLATISSSLQLCSEIIYNILTMPKFIQSCFKRASSVSRHNPVRQTVPCIHHPIRKTKLSQIVFYMRSLISFPLSYMDTCFIQRRSNTWLIFSTDYFICFYHIPSYTSIMWGWYLGNFQSFTIWKTFQSW